MSHVMHIYTCNHGTPVYDVCVCVFVRAYVCVNERVCVYVCVCDVDDVM